MKQIATEQIKLGMSHTSRNYGYNIAYKEMNIFQVNWQISKSKINMNLLEVAYTETDFL